MIQDNAHTQAIVPPRRSPDRKVDHLTTFSSPAPSSNDSESLSVNGIYHRMKHYSNLASNAVNNILPSSPSKGETTNPNDPRGHEQDSSTSLSTSNKVPNDLLLKRQIPPRLISSPSVTSVNAFRDGIQGDSTGEYADSESGLNYRNKGALDIPGRSRSLSATSGSSVPSSRLGDDSHYNSALHLPGYMLTREPSSDSETDSSVYPLKPRLNNLRTGSLSKDFWMKDENATECFNCGNLFTAWRRKHHCRLCGQIFCSSCTRLIDGTRFHHPGKIRACKPCLEMIEKYDSWNHDQGNISEREAFDHRDPWYVGSPVFDDNLSLAGSVSSSLPTSSKYTSSKGRPSRVTMASLPGTDSVEDQTYKAPFQHMADDEYEEKLQRASNGIFDPELYPYVGDDSDRSEEEPDAGNKDDSETATIEPSTPSDSTPRGGNGRQRSSTVNSRDRFSQVARPRSRRRSFGSTASRTNWSKPFQANHLVGSPLGGASSDMFNRRRIFRASSLRLPLASSVELNAASIRHLKRLFHQLLEDSEVPGANTLQWQQDLVPMVIKCVDNIRTDFKLHGDFDIRRSIRIKRIPGAHIGSSSLVSGVVFSKNLALRAMPRSITNPRIVLVAFAMEYQRPDQQFLSLEPVLAQEKEYLSNLVRRIANLHPNLVLAEQNVSGLALEYLERAGIAVAYRVKASVIEAVARCTQADIINSVDKLAMNPRVGRCGGFEVKTYIYQGRKKSFIFLSGCTPGNGCTIILRGGSMAQLAIIKSITEFMIYVVYSLKLETCLMRDEFVLLPSVEETENLEPAHVMNSQNLPSSDYRNDIMEMMKSRILSISPVIKFPIPYLLEKVRYEDSRLKGLNHTVSSFSRIQDNPEKWEFILVEPEHILDRSHINEQSFLGEVTRSIVKEELGKQTILVELLKRQWESYLNQNFVLYDPVYHQHLTCLYTMTCTATGSPCVGPELVTIDYYRDTDIPLGQFIEDLYRGRNSLCREGCRDILSHHNRTYTHGHAKVSVRIEDMKCPMPGLENKILMWSHCKICKAQVPVVPLSESSWNYSFGKYLELSFWCSKLHLRAELCDHNIHKDHIRYFGLHNMAVSIEYAEIQLLEIVVPSAKVVFSPERDIAIKQNEYIRALKKIHKYYDSVSHRLQSINIESMAPEKIEHCRKVVRSLLKRSDDEREIMESKLKEIYMNCSYSDYLPINTLFRILQEKVVQWDSDFSDFEKDFFPSEKDIARLTALQLRKIFLDRDSAHHTPSIEETIDSFVPTEAPASLDEKRPPLKRSQSSSNTTTEKSLHPSLTLRNPQIRGNQDIESERNVPARSAPIVAPTHSSSSKSELKDEQKNRLKADSKASSQTSVGPNQPSPCVETPRVASPDKPVMSEVIAHPSIRTPDLLLEDTLSRRIKSTPTSPELRKKNVEMTTGEERPASSDISPVRPASFTNRSYSGKRAKHIPPALILGEDNNLKDKLSNTISLKTADLPKSSRVSSLAKHFEQLSQEFEKERLRESQLRAASRSRAVPVASSKPIVEVIRSTQDGNSLHEAAVTDEGSQKEPQDHDHKQQFKLSEADHRPEVSSDPTTAYRKPGLLVPPPSPPASTREETSSLNYPPDRHGETSSVASNEMAQTAERTSIMKTLSSFWADKSASGWKTLEYPLISTEHLFSDSDVIVREDEPSSLIAFCLSSSDYLQRLHAGEGKDSDTSEVSPSTNSGQSEVEQILLKKTGFHLKYQLQEGPAKMSCKIFYAEQFDAVRCFCDLQERYIQSMSRCVKFDSSGGKSGSSFLKTLDDRFIIKQLSQTEVDAFLKSAPSFFEYIAQAFFHDLPTVMAKIFGFYQIHIRNSETGKQVRLDCLVMENLWYDRQAARYFDLKGSMRNRHVEQTGKKDEVLLDENMVEYMSESPLFVREYAKKLLRTSLWNDTLFLAKLNVMDYSLVLAIDSKKQELVLGIIDCIRTFTWDKKLESWVKERTLVGGGIKEPTVVTPRQYKNRFREAMERYILMVPGCWYQDDIVEVLEQSGTKARDQN